MSTGEPLSIVDDEGTLDEASATAIDIPGLRLVERARTGAAGAVFLAIDPAGERLRSVEIVVSEPLATAEERRVVVERVRRASAIGHPAIPTLLGAGEIGDRVFVAMEPLAGRSLASLLAEGGPTGADALRLAERIARALAAAHGAAVAHTTLAAGRVVLDEERRLTLVGVGLAPGAREAGELLDARAFGELLRELAPEGADAWADQLVTRCRAGEIADARALVRAFDLHARRDVAHEAATMLATPALLAALVSSTSSTTPGKMRVRLLEGGPEPVTEDLEVLELAGSGGMGEVYRARRASGREVALKVLSRDGGDPRRFAREAAVLATFDHAAVVKYEAHGVTDGDGTPVLVMEWLTGEDLDAHLARGPLSVADTLTLTRHLAGALAEAHARGVVHRDVKPANVLLVNGRVDAPKLLDFGLAREVADRGLTLTGTVLGTPAYMAPEAVRGEAVDARADVYGLGAVMYRCLAGQAPFGGAHRIAVLAKVLVEDPTPLSHHVGAGVPEALEELVSRMLAKDRAARPRDGQAVLDALARLATGAASRRLDGITASEQRVACVVLGASPDGDDAKRAEEDSGDDALEAALARGGVLEPLTRTTWLVTVRGVASLTEQAARAVRCALALAARRPRSPVVVATGRVVASGDVHVGEVIDRAAAALAGASDADAGVRVDDATADLLDDGFDLADRGPWRRVVGERSRLAPVRTLLGRAAACIGRTQELAAMAATLEACAGEPSARALVITAAPGLGKSRLVHEFLTTAVRDRGDVLVLVARADGAQGGSPFGLVSQLVRGFAGILDSDPARTRRAKLSASLAAPFSGDQRRRLEEFLGEIAGSPVGHEEASSALRAARADPAVMGDALREAWLDWLRARALASCVVLVIEDAHGADLSSVRLMDAAIDALADHPLMIVATARPTLSTRFPDLFRKRAVRRISLSPLSRRAALRLVRDALGARADGGVEDAIVDRAAGHPFHLEELVRAVASGHGASALPDSVLGMVQARLDELRPDARRTLRAASVFGETCWSGGVRAVMGPSATADEVNAELGRLAEEEVLTRRSHSRLSGETEYAFRHALVRDAAYAMLTEADRALGHRLVGAWLEQVGDVDPAVLADHHHRGGAVREALRFYRRALDLALEANDLERAASFADRALTCAPDEASEGAIWASQAEIAYWKGSLEEAEERASRAVDRVAPGSLEWFGAVSVALGASGQRGRNDAVARWLDRAARAQSSAELRGAHTIALCRGLTQLAWAHHPADVTVARARLDDLVAFSSDPGQQDATVALEPYERGFVHRFRAESAWLHDRDVDRCMAEFAASCDAFEQARAQRNLCLAQMNWASLAGWSGQTEQGLELVERARREAERIGASFLMLYSLPVRGLIEAYAGLAAADATMRDALPKLASSPRLALVTRVVLGWRALDAGDAVEALTQANAGSALEVAPDLEAAAIALRARAHLALGRAEEAIADAEAAAKTMRATRDLDLTEGIVGLALAEVHDRAGDRTRAREAISHAHERLEAIAGTIARREARDRFWARKLPHDRIAALARAWGAIEIAAAPATT